MKKHHRILIAALAALLVVLTACSSGSGGSDDALVDAADFDADLVEAAQGEGAVSLYTVGTRADAEVLAREFKATFGIPVNIIRDEGASIVQAIESQITAGAVEADVFLLGDPATVKRWVDEGVSEFVDVPNSDDFRPGFYAPESGGVPMGVNAYGILYNTESGEAPRSWADVADGLSGRLAATNPNTSGGAATVYAQVTQALSDAWLSDVLDNNDTLAADSGATVPQLVISGEADYALAGAESLALVAINQGEPIEIAFMADGVPTSTLDTARLADAPNPSAAELLIQFQLHPEIQAALGREGGLRSALADVEQPPGGADLSEAEFLAIPPLDPDGLRDQVREQWTQEMQ